MRTASFLLEFVLFFSGAGKFSLAHWLRQLTGDVNVTFELQSSEVASLMRYHAKHRVTFVESRYST